MKFFTFVLKICRLKRKMAIFHALIHENTKQETIISSGKI